MASSLAPPPPAPHAPSPRPFAAPPQTPTHSASPDRDAAGRSILHLARRLRGAELRFRRGRLWQLRAVAFAPARAAREARAAMKEYGAAAAAEGISPARQFAYLAWLHMAHGVDPQTAYRFRLFSRDRTLPFPRYLPSATAAVLYRTVLQQTAADAAGILADKRRFAAWCAAESLPSAPVLMEFAGGHLSRTGVPVGSWPATDLFAKWATQYGGDLTERFRRTGSGYAGRDGQVLTSAQVVEALARRSCDGIVVLQPCLENHPDFRPLSPRALSTLRIMTTRRPGAEPCFLAGLLRMGTGESTADNFAQGGIASAVDHSTGVAGPARRLDAMQRVHAYDAHPDTGARIAGFRVPEWEAAIALALEAHRRIGRLACVGWDVAVLADGPVLLEGNWNPCTKLLQVATQVPLLSTAFADVFGEWLQEPECRVDDRWLVEHAHWSPV